ncbi:TonB-dependent receptor [bacterium]|nr:TonB-dependent receptor [bacterium]
MIRFFKTCTIIAFILASGSVPARDTLTYEFPRIIVTANRYEKQLFETHLPAGLIHEARIWNSGYTGLGDILRTEAGISQTQTGPWSEKPVIRGLSGAHVLTLVDGLKLNVLREYGDHAPLVDVDQIERIEIIRGPASVLYGSEAVAGVVNIITKSVHASPERMLLKSQFGTRMASVNNQWSQFLRVEGKYGKSDLMLNVTHRRAGDVETPSGPLNNTAFSGMTADLKLGFHIKAEQRLSLSGHLTRMDNVGIPINPYAKEAAFSMYDKNRLHARYFWLPVNKRITHLEFGTYHETGERAFDALIYHVPKGPLYVNNKLNAHRDVMTSGGNFQITLKLFDSNLLTGGIDIFQEKDKTRRIADAQVVDARDQVKADPPADLSPPTPNSGRAGAAGFMEDDWQIMSWLSLNSGFRFDALVSEARGTAGTLTESDLQKTDRDFSGNLGAVIRLSPASRFTINLGRSFRAPSLQERFFRGTAQVGFLEGNPALQSETGFSLDFGFRWKTSRLESWLNVFQNSLNNFIVMKPASAANDTFFYDNVGHAVLRGIEWQAAWRIDTHWSVYANAAYTRGRDTGLSEDLPKIPPLNGRSGVRFENTAGNRWISISGEFAAAQNRVTDNELPTDGYMLLDLDSGLNLQSLIDPGFPLFVTFNIHNLMDKKYRDHMSNVTWWSAPGRNFILGIRGNF